MKTFPVGSREGLRFRMLMAVGTAAVAIVSLGAAEIEHVARLGLYDAAHTAADGLQTSRTWSFHESGLTAGTSTRFLGGPSSSSRGQSAWLADPLGATMRVGFDDAAHTAADGTQTSDFVELSSSGIAVGHTLIPDGGRSAWIAAIADGTSRLGFIDGAHAAGGALPAPYSDVADVNDHGVAVGFSRRQDEGETGWMHDGVNEPTIVGLLAAENTDENGVQISSALEINNAGYVLGVSWRDMGDFGDGTEGWLRTPEGEYRSYAGGRFGGSVAHLTESGYYAVGERDPASAFAYVAHVSGTIRKAGLNTLSREEGLWNSDSVVYLNEAGVAAGYYTNYSLRGNVVWVDTVAYGTRAMGLVEYGSGGPGGGHEYLSGLNASGLVVGYSTDPANNMAGWIADPTGATTRIGLFEGLYLGAPVTYSPNRHHTRTGGINDAGQAWGASTRYHGDETADGQTAWIYDSADGSHTTFDLSVRAVDGYAFSEIHHVLANGIALGTYTRFDAAGTDLGERAFLWLPDEGVVDVGENLDPPVDEAGWEYLTSAIAGNLAGRFVGHGVPVDGHPASQGVYLAELAEADVPPPPPSGDLEYIARLGFYGNRHTHASGYRASRVFDLTESGYTLGASLLFVGADDVSPGTGRTAQTVWVGDATGLTTRVGLYTEGHTRDDGRQENTPVDLNENGLVIGHAARFSGHVYRGENAWIAYPTGATVRLGYNDAAHTGADGSRFSLPVALNNGNVLVGYSRNPDTDATSAWLSNPSAQLTRIGLLDAAHTAPDGTRVSLPVDLNDAGYVIGMSEYYVPGSATAGHTTWLRQPWGATRIIGFQSGVHRAPNGLHDGAVEFLTEAGMIGGHAVRYHPAQNLRTGQTAWLTHVAGPNRPVGLYTGIHAGANNVARSRILGLNEAGYAIGYSAQFPYQAANESDARGRSAWIARPDGTTVKVGLYQQEYTMEQYYQLNHPRVQNESDGVAGTARAGIAVDQGLDAWFATAGAGVSVRLRLPGARFARDGVYWRHVPTHLTNSLKVAGTSARFNGMAESGQTAWIYDHATQTFVTFDLSVRSSDGFAWSRVTTLREDGFATGIYRKFAASGASLGDRAFVFIPGRGAFDAAAALDVAIADDGWALLAEAQFVNAQGHIVGTGRLADYGPGAPPRQFAEGVYVVRRAEP